MTRESVRPGPFAARCRRAAARSAVAAGRYVLQGYRQSRLTLAERAAALLVTCTLFAGRAAAAPSGTINAVLCQVGIGDVLVLGLAAFTVFHVVKGAYLAVVAADKLGSQNPETRTRGRLTMQGALLTTAGAFFPPAFAGVLEAIGVHLLTCLTLI